MTRRGESSPVIPRAKLIELAEIVLVVVLMEADDLVRGAHLIRELIRRKPRHIVRDGRRAVRFVGVERFERIDSPPERPVEPELVADDAATEVAAVAVTGVQPFALRHALRRELGLAVHAGHGLTLPNVAAVSAIPEIEELNIGHHIVSRAVFTGIEAAVRDMRAAMDAARASMR